MAGREKDWSRNQSRAGSFSTRLLSLSLTNGPRGIHRHTPGVEEAGKRQHLLAGGPRRQLHNPVIGEIGDVHGAGGIHRHTRGAAGR